MLSKLSSASFKTISADVSAFEPCHVTIVSGVVNEKITSFEGGRGCLLEFLIFLHENFFGSITTLVTLRLEDPMSIFIGDFWHFPAVRFLHMPLV